MYPAWLVCRLINKDKYLIMPGFCFLLYILLYINSLVCVWVNLCKNGGSFIVNSCYREAGHVKNSNQIFLFLGPRKLQNTKFKYNPIKIKGVWFWNSNWSYPKQITHFCLLKSPFFFVVVVIVWGCGGGSCVSGVR